MLQRSGRLCAAASVSKGNRYSRLNIINRGPVAYQKERWGVADDRQGMPPVKGHMLWRKLIKQFPRAMSWERAETSRHLEKFHRCDIEWGRLRYRYLTIPENEWPVIELKSEEMLMLDIDDWREVHRAQFEGNFGNLRQATLVVVPNNYNIIQRHRKAHEHALFLKKRNANLPKFHPSPDDLLDYEL
ncbi:hypothetical protein DIPPA_00845 [Diplonema papillatum]|nr:hypothetical protein DIPPA_00845 [Diplonema papillatum]